MATKLTLGSEKYKISIMLVLLAISLFLTYYSHFFIGNGIIFTHFFYMPIILASFWWKRKGLIIPIFLSFLLLYSHVLAPKTTYSLEDDFLRILMFLVIGIVVAVLSEQIEKKETKLRESEEKFRSVSQSASDGIITTETNGKIVLFNQSLLHIFNYSQDELEEQNITMIMAEGFKTKFIDGLGKFHSAGSNDLEEKIFESTGVRNDGTEFPIELSMAKWSSGGKYFITYIIRDITERKKARKLLENSLKEKEMLLKEIHHRVKNNLMIISSLLNLQSRYIKDKESKDIFRESQNRAKSMALIHERLYRSSDLKRINFGDYINTLATELLHTYARNPRLIKLNINVKDVMLDINLLIPLGLIVNELITNSLKHAFPEGKSGEIDIGFHLKDENYELTVKDNGIGFPEDLDFRNTDSLGLRIVNSLSDQINGEIELDKTSGTSFKINFAKEKFKG